MEYTRLGKTGLQVSRLCLGMMTYGDPGWRDWVLPESESRPIIQRAVELGINFFDTADMYSRGVSEEVTGRVLRDVAHREEIVVATKVYFNWNEDRPNQGGLSRKHIMDSIDGSLRRLGMDYVDLYQIHRWDYNTPIEETMEALHDVVKAGKARYLGASSMFAWQFMKAQALAVQHRWTPFVSMQNHYNLLYREEEREMIPACIDQGVAVIPWSPLARGYLTGTKARSTARSQTDNIAHNMYGTEQDYQIIERVQEIAQKHDLSPAQVALLWMLNRPGITAPIIGSSKVKHLVEAVEAVGTSLPEDDLQYLEAPYQPREVLGHR